MEKDYPTLFLAWLTSKNLYEPFMEAFQKEKDKKLFYRSNYTVIKYLEIIYPRSYVNKAFTWSENPSVDWRQVTKEWQSYLDSKED